MSVLVDTSVWSLALRRRPGALTGPEERVVRAWRRLVEEGEAVLIGPIRQEVLSGVRDRKTFQLLSERMSAFDDLPLESADYVRAAAFFNACRTKGITGSTIDLLICSAAHRHRVPVFTVDADFSRYEGLLPVQLYVPAEHG